MIIKKIIDYGTDQNCYLLINEEIHECIVIDPGNVFEKVKRFITENEIKVSAILLTHCHYDHVSGLPELKEYTSAEVIASEECKENIKSPVTNVSGLFGEDFFGDYVERTVSEGEKFRVSGIEITCIKTPGHTNCCVCYLVEDKLFSGDTLFLRTTGRWDLPTGNYDVLTKSLRNKLYLMEDDIKVYPGHGHETTLGYEKKYNMSIGAE